MIKLSTYLKTIFAIACLSISSSSFSQIVGLWSNTITGTNPNTDNPYTNGQVYFASDITVSGIGRGTGINGTNANNRYNANGWNSTSMDTADYFYFTIKKLPTTIGSPVINSFAYTGQASGTGPTSFSVRYSVDNFSSEIGTAYASGDTIIFSSGVNVTDSVTFKIFAWGASASNGTFSVNDFEFTGAVPLSIHFDEFYVKRISNTSTISWKLGGTYEGEKIAIQHSTDGKNFNTLKTVGQDIFSYTHTTPAKGANYYRLESIALSGKRTYSQTRTVVFDDSKQQIVLYPNPATSQLNVSINDGAEVKSLVVYNTAGAVVLKSWNESSITTDKLSNGLYKVVVTLADGSKKELPFIIQK